MPYFLSALLGFVIGGMAGVVVCAAGVTSTILQAGAGLVACYTVEAALFNEEA